MKNMNNSQSSINQIVDRVFVINMDKDVEKMRKASKELRKYNIKYERSLGIDVNKLSKNELQNNVTTTCKYLCPKSAIGCGLAHMNVWTKIVNENIDSALILEDDIDLVSNFNTKLTKVWKQVPRDWEMVLLGCSENSCGDSENNTYISKIHKVFTLKKKYQKISKNVRIPKGIIGAHAYIIKRSFAIKILNEFKNKLFYHVDIQMSNSKAFIEGKIYSIIPNLIYQTSVINDMSNNTINRPYFLKYISLFKSKYDKHTYKNNDTTITSLLYILQIKLLKLGYFNLTVLTIIYILLGLIFGKVAYAVYVFGGIMIIDALINRSLIRDFGEIIFDTIRFYFGWSLVG